MILFRYVLSEVARTFLLAFGGLSALIFIAFTLSNLHQVQGISLQFLLVLFPNLLPDVFLITAPASLLIAVTFTIGRLASDGELNALRANGVHLARVLVPCLLLALALSAGCAYITHFLIPQAHYNRRNLFGRVLNGLTAQLGSSVRDFRLGDHYIRFKDFQDGAMIEADIFIVDPKGNREFIRAREARLTLDESEARLIFDLRDAAVTFQTDRKGKDVQTDLLFDRLTREIDLSKDFKKGKSLPDLSNSEIEAGLRHEIRTRYTDEAMRTEWHRRKAVALAPLAFALAAGPLGMLLKRGGRVAVLAAVIIPVFAVYYPLMIGGVKLGVEGRIAPALGAWLADGVLALAGIAAFRGFVKL